ncbi:vitelline membrane outer layer protein 1 [Cherax quadricarinatus]
MNTFSVLLHLLALCLIQGVASLDIDYRENVTSTLTLSNGIDWGDWGPVEFCEEGSYSHGFEVRFEPSGATDETAMSGVKLYCSDKDHFDTGYVTSVVGTTGEWQGMRVCHEGFLTGMRAEVLEPQGILHDDVAVENIEVQCNYDGEILTGVHDLPKFTPGTWGEFEHCDPGSAVCGLQTRYEGILVGDDSGTTDLIFFCCVF